ncbi:HlyD family secretion protein [Sphingomonas sp. BK069]|uniref:HlyD family secretion protein n=1 Tax=Sphingomonas sp. BK069 TaxID=2586979 RepID=UPI0016134C7C|nr:HlyD family secretion protein [Sphingomonas sp. BK069]MBB3348337.1 multidrug resistance efflux pump [Sphingomonas sp. BK069]
MSDAPAAATQQGTWLPPPRGRASVALTLALAALAMIALARAWHVAPFSQDRAMTENASVRGRTTVIAPQVSGYVAEVRARDYREVRAGAVLAVIDDRIYRARVDQARANLSAAMASLANSDQAHASRIAGERSQSAGGDSARAQLRKARADMVRIDDLVSDGSVSMRERDQTLAALALAEAQVRQSDAAREIATQDVRSVVVGRAGLQAQVEAARAQLRLAEIDLSNTVIRAPEDGQLGEIGVRLGQYVTNGTQLVSLVPRDRWVIANFKEEQVDGIRPGDRAVVWVDAMARRAFAGKVELLAPAAGSEFAVIRPDNATGNFVKVPQRIGVRIVLDPGQPGATRLMPGMSVEASVWRRP